MARNYIYRALSACGILAPPVMIISILVAASRYPGYSHITNTVSKLAEQDTSHPELMIAGFIGYGILVTGFSCALYLRIRHGVRAKITWLSIMLYGICMIIAGIFRDIPGGMEVQLNTEGIIHNTAIIVSCISFLIGMWAFAGSVYKRPSWFGFTWFTIGASIVGLILSVVFAFQSYLPVSGLLQRAFYLVPMCWIEIVSVWLFRLTFGKESTHTP